LGVSFGDVGNNVAAYQREKLRLAGLDMFEVVIGSGTAGAPKPDAAPFLAGCEQLGSAPGRTLCLDDNLINDVVGARKAGLPAVLLDRGARHKNSESARVENLAELTREIRENSRDLAARAAGVPWICFLSKTPV
ncbi:HAD family hydrolase, partial [Arthrobacter sp. JCM 19049]|uniref:HAD family hydrolase n=1 Tax=Arthrobacter sp. JCM 19049 TaxID=1460643 RepID=UPI000B1A0261